MSETVSTNVDLLDRVTPTLRRISEGVTGTVSELQRLGRSVDAVGSSTGGVTAATSAVGGLASRARQAAQAITAGLGGQTKAAVSGLGDSMKSAGDGANQAARGLEQFGNGGRGVRGVGIEMGIVSAMTTKAVEAVMALAAAAGRTAIGVVEFGIQSASFKRNMIAGFELMEGSVDKARETYDIIDRFSDLTPFETGNVMTLFKSVRAVGHEMRTTQDIIAGISDVAVTLEPERQKQAMESMVRALGKVQGQGKLTGEALEMINDAAAGSALNTMAIFREVAAMKGITPEQARKLSESGGISAAEGITAFLRAVQSGVDKGGALGTATKKFGIESLGGQMSTFDSRLKKLFADVDISPLVRVMTKVNDLLSESSPTGQVIRRFINDTLGGMFSKAERWLTPGNIEGALQTVQRAIEMVTTAVGDLWSGFSSAFEGIPGLSNDMAGAIGTAGEVAAKSGVNWRVFGEALGVIANAIIKVVNAAQGMANMFANDGPVNRTIFKIVDGIANKFAREDRAARDERAALDAASAAAVPQAAAARVAAVAAGGAVASGMAEGMMSQAPLVSSAANVLASSASDTVTSSLEIRSPSQRLRRIGAQTGEGMALGIEDTEAKVGQAMAAIVNPPLAPNVANQNAGTKSGGAGLVVNVGDIIVQGAANAAAGREAGQAVAGALRDEMMVIFEQWAAMG
jgi:hypothetical protein